MFVYYKMMENTTYLTNSPCRKDKRFENWLFEHGYFYIKTKDNCPCFKSKLTCDLYRKFQEETEFSKLRQGRGLIKITNKISLFKCS